MSTKDVILWSTDQHATSDRLRISDDGFGLIEIVEETMPFRGCVHADPTSVHDKLILTPAQALWLRDSLNEMDLGEDEKESVPGWFLSHWGTR